jgi:DNA-binding transcriptional LysR family regulator
LSQSAVSAGLHELENQLDTRVFERIGKRLALNAEGEALKAQAQPLLDQAQTLQQDFSAGNNWQRVRFAASTTIGNYYCPLLLAQARRELPPALTTGLPELLIRNTADVIALVQSLRRRRVDRRGMSSGRTRLRAVAAGRTGAGLCQRRCAAEHEPRSAAGSAETGAMAAARTGLRTREVWEQQIRPLLADQPRMAELGQSEAIKQAVAAGLGIAYLSRIAVTDMLNNGTLAELQLPTGTLYRQLYLICTRKSRTKAATALFSTCASGNHPPAAPETMQKPAFVQKAMPRKARTIADDKATG